TLHFMSSSRLFSFNATATTHIYTLSLHDALPIYNFLGSLVSTLIIFLIIGALYSIIVENRSEDTSVTISELALDIREGEVSEIRSEEHTSELQSRENLVCRLLLEKKKNEPIRHMT